MNIITEHFTTEDKHLSLSGTLPRVFRYYRRTFKLFGAVPVFRVSKCEYMPFPQDSSRLYPKLAQRCTNNEILPYWSLNKV